MIINTPRLSLRAFTEDDFEFLLKLHLNPEIAKTAIDGVQSKEQIKEHLDNFISHHKKFGYSQMAIFEKESGEFVGRAGITNRVLNHDFGAQNEIRISILPEFWNKKYASEIIPALLKFAFEELNLEFLVASILPENQKSINLFLKHGFKFIKNIKPCYGNLDAIIGYYLLRREEF